MSAPGQDPYTSFTLGFLPYKGALQGLIGALVVLGATVWFYFYITAFENGEMAEASAWWPVAMIYNVAGKWPVIVLGVLIGIAGVVYGAFDLLKVMRAQKLGAGAGLPNPASPQQAYQQGFQQSPQQQGYQQGFQQSPQQQSPQQGFQQSPQQGFQQSPQQGFQQGQQQALQQGQPQQGFPQNPRR